MRTWELVAFEICNAAYRQRETSGSPRVEVVTHGWLRDDEGG